MTRRLNSLIFLILVLIAGSSFAAELSISRINNAKSGERKTITISADSIASHISGFNLLVAYDQSLSFVYDVRPGDLHKDYGWEYFNYRLIIRDTLSAHMPGFSVHLINIMGLASLSGAPPPALNAGSVALAELDVMLALSIGSFSDETWIPFSFFWRDCNDNVLTSLSGDSLYTASHLYENKSSSTSQPVSFAFPGFGNPDSPCPTVNGQEVVKNIDYVNSGIWSFVFDPYEECLNGDINLNGIPYEIADIVLFIDFFQSGISVLPWPPEASLAQTDCNCDGMVISVGDLVCFVRKAIGDTRYAKIPVPSEGDISISLQEGEASNNIILNSNSEVALTYLRIVSRDNETLVIGDFRIHEASFKTGQIGDTITMMLVDMDGNSVLSAGKHQLFEYTGNSELEIQAWVVDMNGNETALKLETGVLPESPKLLQNYPNPFNPSTTIEIDLPTEAKWEVGIYNITGQLIKNYSGIAAGTAKIGWDGTDSDGVEVASGVYFYKLIVNEVTLSHKMVLLK